MDTYRKIGTNALSGSFVELEPDIRCAFICFILMADIEGNLEATPKVISRVANLSSDLVARTLAVCTAPDPESRTPTAEGRRMVPLVDAQGDPRPWGWRIVNADKYSKAIPRRKNVASATESIVYSNRKASRRIETKGSPNCNEDEATDDSYDKEDDEIREREGARSCSISVQVVEKRCEVAFDNWLDMRNRWHKSTNGQSARGTSPKMSEATRHVIREAICRFDIDVDNFEEDGVVYAAAGGIWLDKFSTGQSLNSDGTNWAREPGRPYGKRIEYYAQLFRDERSENRRKHDGVTNR